MRGNPYERTPEELQALAAGQAYLYRGRVIPIIRGGDDGDGDGDGDGGDGNGGDGGDGNGDGDGDGEGDDKVFKQADVDRIVQERVARERKKYEGHDDLKRKAGEYDKLQEGQKSELQKAQDRAAQAEAERDRVSSEVKETRLRAAILTEAAKPGRNVADPDAVYRLLDREALELDDGGNPKNAEEAVDSLLEQRPYLVATQGGGGRSGGAADQGARGGGPKQLTSTEGMSQEEIAKALEEGRLTEYLKTPK